MSRQYQDWAPGCMRLEEIETVFERLIPFEEIILDGYIEEIFTCTETSVDLSIGICYQNGLGEDESQARYVVNLFWNGEYININGDYSRDELMLDSDLHRRVLESWNVCAVKSQKTN